MLVTHVMLFSISYVTLESDHDCCAQGLEFIPAGDCVYPDDFPPALTEINVTGTFNTLEDDGETYCALTDAVYYW